MPLPSRQVIDTDWRARLESEMALVRRAVEHLATEKAERAIRDCNTTLGEMGRKLKERILSVLERLGGQGDLLDDAPALSRRH